MVRSTISVPIELKKQLNELKLHSREPYADVITRLVACAENVVLLSDEETTGVKEALDENKAGRMKSSDSLWHELGR
ncbi:MAG: hypothetical protein LBV40_04355 [Methanomicrobiales archaeon]|jgi:hypothetical protein|nr:hypothetical protein [Methanomicrobiales archaeon]